MFFSRKNISRKPFNVIVEHVGIMIPCIAIIAASFFFSPADLEEKKGVAKILPQCMFKKITGLPCPTCGMSRAFCSISRFCFADALSYNPISILFYPIIIAGVILPPLSLVHYWITRTQNTED